MLCRGWTGIFDSVKKDFLLRLARAWFFLATLVSATALISSCSPSDDSGDGVSTSEQPNIVLIVIDDMGYNDLGANGNTQVSTPNLDRRASQGVRFTRHYTDSTCTVTRVGIMTGMEPAVHGFRANNLGISPEVVTLPEALQSAGYSTHHVGKWHIGFESRLAWPTQQGFDTFFGFLDQHLLRGPHADGKWKIGGTTYHNPWLQHQSDWPTKHDGHLSEILTDHAVDFIESRKNSDRPWFLNFWTYAPHAPIQPMAKFASKYPDTPKGKYLAFLEQVDDTVGRVLKSLDDNGLGDNTLVLVASDNGGTNAQMDNNFPFKGRKMTFYEGGVRTPLIMRWPGRVAAGEAVDEVVSYLDYFPTLASVAGAQIPAHLAGRNLIDVAQNDADPAGSLYWELSNAKVTSWAVLSKDARWRMSHDFFDNTTLNDLADRPAGDQNVLASYPEVAEDLRRDYLAWRRASRKVAVDYEPIAANGRARLSGNSLQRAPGYSGHTFAIAVTPYKPTAPGGPQVIAYQRNQWQLYLSGSRLHLVLNGIELDAPAPEAGACSTILVTSHFKQAYTKRSKKSAMVELYVNGMREAEFRSGDPKIPIDDHLNPTFIGQDEHGERVFRGELGRPVILNERLVPEDENNGKTLNGITPVENILCPQATS